jgi:ribosomal small subunit protein bTHX
LFSNWLRNKLINTEEISMGRGDQRSKRGKISRGTSGKTRPNPKQKKRAKAAKKKAGAATQG